MRAPEGWNDDDMVRCSYCGYDYPVEEAVQIYTKVVDHEAKGKCRRCNNWLQRNRNHGLPSEKLNHILREMVTIIEMEKAFSALEDCCACGGTGKVEGFLIQQARVAE